MGLWLGWSGKPGPHSALGEKKSFAIFFKTIGLDKALGIKAQRIGAMPNDELAKAFDEARKAERLLHYSDLIVRARPYC